MMKLLFSNKYLSKAKNVLLYSAAVYFIGFAHGRGYFSDNKHQRVNPEKPIKIEAKEESGNRFYRINKQDFKLEDITNEEKKDYNERIWNIIE